MGCKRSQMSLLKNEFSEICIYVTTCIIDYIQQCLVKVIIYPCPAFNARWANSAFFKQIFDKNNQFMEGCWQGGHIWGFVLSFKLQVKPILTCNDVVCSSYRSIRYSISLLIWLYVGMSQDNDYIQWKQVHHIGLKKNSRGINIEIKHWGKCIWKYHKNVHTGQNLNKSSFLTSS